jgi:hypothetical protein
MRQTNNLLSTGSLQDLANIPKYTEELIQTFIEAVHPDYPVENVKPTSFVFDSKLDLDKTLEAPVTEFLFIKSDVTTECGEGVVGTNSDTGERLVLKVSDEVSGCLKKIMKRNLRASSG